MHFDFQVANIQKMVQKAIDLGATKAINQYGNGDFNTMFDPSGHPFCLCKQ